MAINFGRKFFDRVLIFRPHNVYGPDMGFEHVIPEFAVRLQSLAKAHREDPLPFQIQGTGEETRSFCFIDDLVAGIMIMRDRGEHLGIYHVGTMEEVRIGDLARRIGRLAGREIEPIPGSPSAGGTARRCPNIAKLAQLGYKPRVSLDEGLKLTLDWYWSKDLSGQLPDRNLAQGSQHLHPIKVARAAGTGASTVVECCQICGHTPLEDMLSLGYMPPPEPIDACWPAAQATIVVSHQFPLLPKLRGWRSSASSLILPSYSPRNFPTPPVIPRRCATISLSCIANVRRCSVCPHTILLSTSARMTVHCWQISKRRAIE
jgi:hypothetical protein